VVAHDELAAPGRAAVLADRRANAVVAQAIAVDADDAAVAHLDEAAGRAEIVHARKETPRAAAVVALVDLGPHVALWGALAAQRAEDAAVVEHDRARIEPAVAAVRGCRRVLAARVRERVALRRDEGHEVELGAAVQADVD